MAETQKDPNQILRAEHDEANNAKKVIIVGGSFDSEKLTESFQKALDNMQINMPKNWPLGGVTNVPGWPQIQPGDQLHTHETVKEVFIPQVQIERFPEYIKETVVQLVEIPVIQREIEVKIIEVPKYIDRIEYKTIEVPIAVKEIQTIEIEKTVPVWFKISFILQSLALIGLLITQILK